MTRRPPLLLVSDLTGRAYIVTAYGVTDDGRFTARTKFDVTADLARIVDAAQAHAWRLGHDAESDAANPYGHDRAPMDIHIGPPGPALPEGTNPRE